VKKFSGNLSCEMNVPFCVKTGSSGWGRVCLGVPNIPEGNRGKKSGKIALRLKSRRKKI